MTRRQHVTVDATRKATTNDRGSSSDKRTAETTTTKGQRRKYNKEWLLFRCNRVGRAGGRDDRPRSENDKQRQNRGCCWTERSRSVTAGRQNNARESPPVSDKFSGDATRGSRVVRCCFASQENRSKNCCNEAKVDRRRAEQRRAPKRIRFFFSARRFRSCSTGARRRILRRTVSPSSTIRHSRRAPAAPSLFVVACLLFLLAPFPFLLTVLRNCRVLRHRGVDLADRVFELRVHHGRILFVLLSLVPFCELFSRLIFCVCSVVTRGRAPFGSFSTRGRRRLGAARVFFLCGGQPGVPLVALIRSGLNVS